MVTERRRVELPAGRSEIVFDNVNDRMIPQSALLRSFSGFTIERNFDYALLGKQTLFAKNIGKRVEITRTDAITGTTRRVTGEIVSADRGVVLKIGEQYEAFECSGLGEAGRFAGLPAGLTGKPQLSIEVDAKVAGRQDIEISYLADQFSWRADYRYDLNEREDAALLNAWITLKNDTAQSFKNTSLSVIAGELNRSGDTRPPSITGRYFYAQCWPKGSTKTGTPSAPVITQSAYSEAAGYRGRAIPAPAMMEMGEQSSDQVIVTATRRKAKQEDLGDYKLYKISDPVTVAAHQSKQIRFLQVPEVKFEKRYTLDMYLYNNYRSGQLDPLSIQYRADNSRDGALAKPLPRGEAHMMTRRANGTPFFLGAAPVRDTAVDNPQKIYLDETMLLMADIKLSGVRTTGRKRQGDAVITITSANDEPALAVISVNPSDYEGLKISKESLAHTRADGPIDWHVTVPPGEAQTLEFSFQYGE